MRVQLEAGGWRVAGRGAGPGLLRFVDSVLRGIAQVMLQDNRYAGLLFLIGICWNSWLFGAATLLGAAVSTATARALALDGGKVRAGLYGFNGALVGIALLYFLRPDALTWACVVVAAACSTSVTAALSAWLERWHLPAFTAPFVFVSWGFFLATARFGRLHSTDLLPTAGLPTGTRVEGIVDAATIGNGIFNGIAEVFFQANAITGVLFFAGLLVASRRIAVAALAGSLAGLLVAWGMGAAEPAIRSGAFGFNSVLVAIALAGALDLRRRPERILMAIALLATPFAFAALSAALQPLGMPALTFPFVLVAWMCLLASSALPERGGPTG